MGKKRKQRLCHICKKRPIWIGGDVKNPGPVCKRCYHERVWPDRLKRGGQAKQGSAAPEKRDGGDEARLESAGVAKQTVDRGHEEVSPDVRGTGDGASDELRAEADA